MDRYERLWRDWWRETHQPDANGEYYFDRQMTQTDLHRGHRAGVRACVSWLHRRAAAMNDPHAKAVLNVAAHDLGVEKPSDDRELAEFADTLALCTNARNARGDLLLGEQGLRRLVQLLRGEASDEAP